MLIAILVAGGLSETKNGQVGQHKTTAKVKAANQGLNCKLRYRSCRNKSQVIQFKNDAYRNGTWFPKKVKGMLFFAGIGYQVPRNCDYGTDKTCTNCGDVHKNLGGSKIYKCPQCGHAIPWDINGARNIMLRALQD